MSSPWVVDVTDDTFEAEVLQRSKETPVVVDFWAEWCGPCRVLGPILEKIAEESGGSFILAKVDTESAPRTSQTFGIRSIPTVFAFKDGAPGESFSGALPEPAVREFVGRLVPSEQDQKVREAESLLSSDPTRAEALLREVVDADPLHDEARLVLAELMFGGGEHDEVQTLLDPLLPPTGVLADRVEHLRSELALNELRTERTEDELRALLSKEPKRADLLLELGQHLASQRRYPDALEALLAAAAADRTLATGRAKELMVDIFHAVGVRSELADDFRTRLTRLLY